MDLGKHCLGFQLHSSLWFHMALKILDFCYSFAHTGISMLTVHREIISKDENVFLPGSQQIWAVAGCLFPLPGQSPRGRIKWGARPTTPPQGFHSNVLPAEQPSQANACLSTAPFALGSTRIELHLETQGLLTSVPLSQHLSSSGGGKQGPWCRTRPVLLWSPRLYQPAACSLADVLGRYLQQCLWGNPHPGLEPNIILIKIFPSPRFAARVLLSKGLSTPQHRVNFRN